MSKPLSRREAADRLGISLVTLDAARNEGRLAYIQHKPNGKVWITEEAIEEYLARGTHTPAPLQLLTRPTYRKKRA